MRASLIALPLLVTSLLGCELDQPCKGAYAASDSGYGCVLVPDAGPPRDAAGSADAPDATQTATTADAGVGLDAGGSVLPVDAGDRCPDPGFGTPCSVAGPDAPECTCEADFCALQPGQTSGFCTRTGCLGQAGVCAPGYACFDLSTIAPELGSICVPE